MELNKDLIINKDSKSFSSYGGLKEKGKVRKQDERYQDREACHQLLCW